MLLSKGTCIELFYHLIFVLFNLNVFIFFTYIALKTFSNQFVFFIIYFLLLMYIFVH